MIVDGVNFNEKAIKGMELNTFLSQTTEHLWTDCDKKLRRQRLEEVWKRINPADNKAEE